MYPKRFQDFLLPKQGPGFALPVLGFAHGREGRRSDQGQSSHGGKDLWPADGGGTGAGAGRCDGAGSLVPLHLPVRGRDHHPGHQPAPGDHPELRLSSPGGDPGQEPGPGSPAPRPHRAAGSTTRWSASRPSRPAPRPHRAAGSGGQGVAFSGGAGASAVRRN